MSDEPQDTTEREVAGWNGECIRCGSSDEWGASLFDDYAGLERFDGLSIDLCADCRDAFEDWLDGGDQ